jgi:hypothetical protein
MAVFFNAFALERIEKSYDTVPAAQFENVKHRVRVALTAYEK